MMPASEPPAIRPVDIRVPGLVSASSGVNRRARSTRPRSSAADEDRQRRRQRQVDADGERQRRDAGQLHHDRQHRAQDHQSPGQLLGHDPVDQAWRTAGAAAG